MKTDDVEPVSAFASQAWAAVANRRPQLFAKPTTASEETLLDLIEDLLAQVMDWEDYNRRVEFVMRCMEGDLLGQIRKCRSVRQGEADDGNSYSGSGFVPAIQEDE